MKLSVWMICLFWPLTSMALTRQPETTLPGRLFYTPAQRNMLNEARVRQITELPKMSASASLASPAPSAPVSFDGVITRSDGIATHWINGHPHVGRSSDKVRNLKPGQTRAAQKVYEPYQIRQPDNARVTSPVPASPPVKPARPEEPAP